MKRLILILVPLIITFNIAQGQIKIVSDAPYIQYHADIDGDYIVYWGNQNGFHHIYLYKISDSSTIKISTNDNSGKGHPKISGNYIVWSENRTGDYDIYFYDINNPQLGVRPLLVRNYDQFVEDIDGTKVLIRDNYGDFPNLDYKLICYDISTSEEIIIQHDYASYRASISGPLIVYDQNGDIYLHNLQTHETKIICDDPAEQRNPTISGQTIVWEDNRNVDWDLYQCNLWYLQFGPQYRYWPLFLFPTRGDQLEPNINGDRLVFIDNRTGNFQVYLYKYNNRHHVSGTNTKISNSNYEIREPIVDNDNIVWWDDKEPDPYITSESDVFLWQRPPGADLALTMNTTSNSFQLYEYITYTIVVNNQGPLQATNISIDDTISNKIEIISTNSTAGLINVSNNIATCNIDSLPPDSSITITIIGRAIQLGTATSIAYVSAQEPDYIIQNNRDINDIRIQNVRNYKNFSVKGIHTPKIKVDQSGFIHIIAIASDWDTLYYITNKTGNWANEIVSIAGGDVFITEANFDIDNQGNVHICEVRMPPDPYNILEYINNVTGSWVSTFPLGPSSGKITKPTVKIDKENNAHISYITGRFSGELYYLNNKTGNWSSPELISNTYISMSMDLDTSGYVHMVTYDVNQGPIYFTNAPNGQWQMPEIVEQNWIGGQLETLELDIDIDNTNAPHISYVGKYFKNEDYKYATKLNGNWQNEFVAQCGYIGGYNCIIVDKNHKPYILYENPTGELGYAQKDSSFFITSAIETEYNNFLSGNFDLTIDTYNNIHYVYVKNDNLYYGTNALYTVNYGGGDENSGGYFFANSISGGIEVPSKPTYNWIDPISNGHHMLSNWTNGNANDGYAGPISLPFNFQYYNLSFNQIYINTNGYLSFSQGYTETAENTIIPFVDPPNNIIAACAMDLNLDTNIYNEARVYYGNDGSRFIVTYYHAHVNYAPADYITFQIILYTNGNILFQYNNSESSFPLPNSIANDALIGIEDALGMKGISYRNNGAGGPIFGSPLAVMFGSNALVLPVDENPVQSPNKYFLAQNYPNPFNPSTTIRFEIPKTTHVSLKIYNILGQEVAELVNEEKKPGVYNVNWNASSLASGVYIYNLQSGEFVSSKKMMLLK